MTRWNHRKNGAKRLFMSDIGGSLSLPTQISTEAFFSGLLAGTADRRSGLRVEQMKMTERQ